eukprot:UC4_evm8s293
MLQVGCAHGPGGSRDPGLNDAETRTHFAAWAIVSSPLTLSHDVNDDAVSEKIWDVISNTEILEVSQSYSGHSGSPFSSSEKTVLLTDAHIEALEYESPVETPSWQAFYKPLEPNGAAKTAVLLINSDTSSQTITVNFKDVPEVTCTTCHVRDIFAKKDLGTFDGKWSASVESHDSAFILITPN